MSEVNSNLPSIPDYFKRYVDPKVDLNETPSIPCPFHNEVNGKSFSYSRQLNIWRCFGACHCGGDVVDLHRLNYRFRTKEEAKKSLYRDYGINVVPNPSFQKEEVFVDPKEVFRRHVYGTAVRLAKNRDDWLELDYIVSKVPYDVEELVDFCTARGVNPKREEM